MGKVSGFILPIGIALVILIYTTLAVLAFTTARADNSFASRNIEFNQKYYYARGNYERTVAVLVGSSISLRADGSSYTKGQGAFDRDRVQDLMGEFQGLSLRGFADKSLEFSYETKITENTAYYVDFTLDLDDNIRVENEGVMDTSHWEEENYIVWDG